MSGHGPPSGPEMGPGGGPISGTSTSPANQDTGVGVLIVENAEKCWILKPLPAKPMGVQAVVHEPSEGQPVSHRRIESLPPRRAKRRDRRKTGAGDRSQTPMDVQEPLNVRPGRLQPLPASKRSRTRKSKSTNKVLPDEPEAAGLHVQEAARADPAVCQQSEKNQLGAATSNCRIEGSAILPWHSEEGGSSPAIGTRILQSNLELEKLNYDADSVRAGANSSGDTATVLSHRSSHSSMTQILSERHRRKEMEQHMPRSWPDPGVYGARSLWLFGLGSWVRRGCIAAIEWKWFDRIILALIALNTVQLAMFDPFDTPELRPHSRRREVMDLVGKVFSCLFLAECVVKVTALGLVCGSKTYLRAPWNCVDMLIVVVGILDFLPAKTSNLSSLRALRVLRPLRAITWFPQLRSLVELLLQCVPMLSNVFGICAFIFFVFGILAVQLFQGVFHGQCYDLATGEATGSPCSQGSGCSEGLECLLLGENEGSGIIHFDNIGGAVTTIFQIMTLEEWAGIMYRTMESTHYAALVFFVALVLVGPIFAIQLFLVVIVNKFGQSRKQTSVHDEAPAVPSNLDPTKTNDAFGDTMDSLPVNLPASPTSEATAPSPPPPQLVDTQNPDPSKHAAAEDSSRMKVSQHGNGGNSSQSSSKKGRHRHRASQRSITRKLQWRLRILAKSDLLLYTVLAVIVVNTLTMAIDHDCDMCDGTSFCPKFKSALEISNIGFTAVFVGELMVKLIGLGIWRYFRTWLNWVDVIIVVVSLIEIPAVLATFQCYQSIHANCEEYYRCEEGVGGMSVLRAFRLVRLVKMLKALPEIQKQVVVLVQVMGSVVSLVVLIVIMLLVFLVLGMNVLGGNVVQEWSEEALALGAHVFVAFPWDPTGVERYGRITGANVTGRALAPWRVEIRYGGEEQIRSPLRLDADGSAWAASKDMVAAGVPQIVAATPRLNYDDFPHALVSTFQVLTLSNWNDSMYQAVASIGPQVAFFYYAIIVLGTWMLLNVFIAILIQEFAAQKLHELEEDLKKMQENFLQKLGGLEEGDLKERLEALFDSIDLDRSGEIDKFEFSHALAELGIRLRPKNLQDLVSKFDKDGSGSISYEEFLAMIQQLLDDAHMAVSSEAAKLFKDAAHLQQEHELHREMSLDANPPKQLRSCWCIDLHLPRDNLIRRAAVAIMEHPLFDNLILLCIFLSSCSLAIDRPYIGDDSPERTTIETANFVLNVIFLAEFVVKVVALNFREYIKSGWNKIDFLIVVTSVVDEILARSLNGEVDVTAFRVLRIFRILRALRPLRIVARAKGLRVLAVTLVSSIRPVANTSILAVLSFSVLGILGMQLLGGKLHRCSDPWVWEKKACVGDDADGNLREWLNYDVNFDNFWQAIRSMFILATQDEWPNHMWAGVDATGKLTGPWQDHNLGMLVYYMSCLVLTAYLVVNIFVGVFVDCYRTAATDSDAAETPKLRRDQLPRIYPDPEGGVRGFCFKVVTSRRFDIFIAFCITANVVAMAFESWKPAEWQNRLQEVANSFFGLLFGFECLTKLMALHPSRYFDSNWNRFDYCLVIVSMGQKAVDTMQATLPLHPSILRVARILRIFRILRAFRLFRAVEGLREIASTLMHSLTGIAHLFSMLGLIFFIFGVLGVTIFGQLCTEGDEREPGLSAVRCWFTEEDRLLPRQATFRHVGAALLTLFRVSTADAWGKILTITQLAPGSREVTAEVWRHFTEQIGYDPEAVAAGDARGFGRGSEGAGLRIAEAAIRGWSAAVRGLDGEPGWPRPREAPEAEEWIQLARLALPGCLTVQEAKELQQKGLLECTAGGYAYACPGTCGEWLLANVYFMVFVCCSNFVLMQLVIAVLMDQLVKEKEHHKPHLVPGCHVLSNTVLNRLYRRWRYKTAAKLRREAKHEAEAERKPSG